MEGFDCLRSVSSSAFSGSLQHKPQTAQIVDIVNESLPLPKAGSFAGASGLGFRVRALGCQEIVPGKGQAQLSYS